MTERTMPREPTEAMIRAGYAVLGEPDNESPVRNAWRAIFDAAPTAAQPIADADERPPYPEGNVIGPCVCGSWPGGPCLRCKWIPADANERS